MAHKGKPVHCKRGYGMTTNHPAINIHICKWRQEIDTLYFCTNQCAQHYGDKCPNDYCPSEERDKDYAKTH